VRLPFASGVRRTERVAGGSATQSARRRCMPQFASAAASYPAPRGAGRAGPMPGMGRVQHGRAWTDAERPTLTTSRPRR
jgi:hypothetical protein